MPNTNPPTSNKKEFQRKLDLAKNRMYCNYSFYFGATAENYSTLEKLKDLNDLLGDLPSKVEDLNKQQEEGKAQLEQLVNSEELRTGITQAGSELQQVLESGAVETGIKNTVSNAKPIIQGLQKKLAYIDTQAFKDIGREVVFASGAAQAADNSKATNNIKNTLKNTLTEMKSLTVKESFKGIFEGAEEIVSASKGIVKDMVNSTFDSLSPELNDGLHKLYKDEYGETSPEPQMDLT